MLQRGEAAQGLSADASPARFAQLVLVKRHVQEQLDRLLLGEGRVADDVRGQPARELLE